MADLTLECDGCQRTIYIPKTMPPDKAQRQLGFASVELPRNFLCPHCSQVFSYPIGAFQIRRSEMPVPREPLECPICVSVNTRCDDKNCTALVRVSVIVNLSDDIRADALASITAARYFAARCQQGHMQKGKAMSGAFEVFLEPDWTPKN